MEYKKSYFGFILWLFAFIAAFFAVIFLPEDIMNQTQLLVAIEDNILTIGIFVLTFLVYSAVSIWAGIPYGVDIAVVVVGLVATAVSTIKIKL